MKKSELQQIIREEYNKIIAEAPVTSQMKSRAMSVVSTIDIKKFDTAVLNIAEDLMKDGFDKDDILDLLNDRIEKLSSKNFSKIPTV